MKTKAEKQARRKRIKEKFIKFFSKIKELFKELDDVILPKISATALKIMQGFKKVVDSDVIDIITDFTPTNADDKLVQKIRLAIDKSIGGLTIWKQCESDFETLEEKILCFAKHLKELPKDVQSAYYTQLHTQILAELDEHKLSLSEYTLYASVDYLESKIENV